jgi:hypothetical protein
MGGNIHDRLKVPPTGTSSSSPYPRKDKWYWNHENEPFLGYACAKPSYRLIPGGSVSACIDVDFICWQQ